MVEKSNNSFGKKLASADKKTRDNAVKSLSRFLSNKKNLTDLELLKLWKGLFYCYWMSDKQLIQQQLANQLGSLLLKIPNEMVFKFLKAFWKIIISEWNGLDRLRIDKYYYLMRRIHFYTFKFLEKVSWRKQYVLEYIDLYDTGPLCFLNDKIPHAIHYHICEVFFQILEEAIEKPIPKKAFQKLLEPFIDIVTFSFDYILIEHATSEIFLYLYKQLCKGFNIDIDDDDDDNDDDDDENMESEETNNNDKITQLYCKSVDIPELYCQLTDLSEEPTTNPSNIEILNYISDLFYTVANDKLEKGDSDSDDSEYDEINAEYDIEPEIVVVGSDNKENLINKPSILKIKKTIPNDKDVSKNILKKVKNKKIKKNKSKKNVHWNLNTNKIKLFDKNDKIIDLIK